jgi:hypothetical protein
MATQSGWLNRSTNNQETQTERTPAMQTTETMSSVANAGEAWATPPTEAELDYVRTGLAARFPHLSCTVEMVDGTLYVKAVKA